MKKTKLSLLVLCFLAFIPTFARAEWFLDVYGGEARNKNSEVEASITASSLGFGWTTSHTEKADFDPSFTYGARGGYWFAKLPYVGLSLDLSYFRAEDKNVDIKVVPMSLLLMVRAPLFKSEKFPYGRIQPYAAIGPSFFYYYAKVDFRPNLPEKISGDDADIGIDLRAGLSWQLHRHWAIFGEYRYTDIEIDFTNTDILFGLVGSQESMKTHLETNHFLIGVSYRF